MTVPNFTIIFWLFASLFAGNAGFYLFEILKSPRGMATDPGNTFAMFADFGICLAFIIFGCIAIVQHNRYGRDNRPIGKAK